jgi:hypothetical protein
MSYPSRETNTFTVKSDGATVHAAQRWGKAWTPVNVATGEMLAPTLGFIPAKGLIVAGFDPFDVLQWQIWKRPIVFFGDLLSPLQ